MSFYGENNVITGKVMLLWDGIRNPDTRQKRDGSSYQSWNVRVAMPKNAPEVQELTQIATKALQESEWRGQLPPGANWPLQTEADVAKFGERVTNCLSIGAATTNGVPPIYDPNGQPLDGPMAWGQHLYPGAVIKLLVDAYPYNNVQKGIAFGLSGIQIIDSTKPKLDVGGGMSREEVARAFTGGSPAPAAATGYPPIDTTSAAQPVMTAKANGMTAEQFYAAGWTVEQLIENGYAERPAAAPAPSGPPVAPSGPPAAPTGPNAPAGDFTAGPQGGVDDDIPF